MIRCIKTHWVLLTITVAGALLRFTNLNWDLGGRLHPDEALIVNGAMAVRFFSHLAPGFHDYNGLSVYLLKLVSLGVSLLPNASRWTMTPEGMTVIGRYISALLSAVSVPLLYIIGKQLWKKETGLIAAFLFAVTPMSSQLARFYTTESLLIFLLLILLMATVRYIKKSDVFALSWMGITAGLLLATKNTSYMFLPIPGIAILLTTKRASSFIRAAALWSVACVASFFVASPYSFIDWPGYIERSQYLAAVVSGRLLMDWTMQFQNTNGFWWVKNLFYAFGPLAAFGTIGILGFILHRKSRTMLPVITALWSVGFIVFLACTYLKFTRYASPLMPFFALFAAKLLWDIQKIRAGRIILIAATLSQFLYGSMFFPVYASLHTSLRAANWIAKNVPHGSVLLTEEWNSIVRFSRPELKNRGYRIVTVNMYTLPDGQTKTDNLYKTLAQSDYVLLESPKVKNTIMRQQDRYPNASAFYESLVNGALGFTKVAEFSSYPRMGIVAIPDDDAEETLTVFDHPTITLYKRQHICSPVTGCN